MLDHQPQQQQYPPEEQSDKFLSGLAAIAVLIVLPLAWIAIQIDTLLIAIQQWYERISPLAQPYIETIKGLFS